MLSARPVCVAMWWWSRVKLFVTYYGFTCGSLHCSDVNTSSKLSNLLLFRKTCYKEIVLPLIFSVIF